MTSPERATERREFGMYSRHDCKATVAARLIVTRARFVTRVLTSLGMRVNINYIKSTESTSSILLHVLILATVF